ncbi:MAG: hypothetical protein RL386_1554 [Bacteroidota bacterium]|jgi:nucleotide-binding universal stress UspA family protein
MRKIHRILFPTDFSEAAQNAFRYCRSLADALSAEIFVLHVVYPEYELLDLPVLATKATHDKIDAAKDALNSFVGLGAGQAAVPDDLKTSQEVEVGTPVGIIRQNAQKHAADLIVMGTKGEHNALEKTLGSVTTGVIEGAHCPVLVVPEHTAWRPPHIVAFATNLSEADPYHVWKAAEILEPFHPLMHIIHISDEKKPAGRTTRFDEVEAFFRHQANDTPALQLTFHELERASVTEGLEEFSDNHEVDLLVMFAPRHSWSDRLFKPSATRKMALDAPLPLLFLKNP